MITTHYLLIQAGINGASGQHAALPVMLEPQPGPDDALGKDNVKGRQMRAGPVTWGLVKVQFISVK